MGAETWGECELDVGERSPSVKSAKKNVSACLFNDKLIYIIEGKIKVERYDIEENQWEVIDVKNKEAWKPTRAHFLNK